MFWVAILAIFFSNGDVKTGAYPSAFTTEAACQAALAEGGQEMRASPPDGALAAVGKCVQMSNPLTAKQADEAPESK